MGFALSLNLVFETCSLITMHQILLNQLRIPGAGGELVRVIPQNAG
jgi:hypothetical protein